MDPTLQTTMSNSSYSPPSTPSTPGTPTVPSIAVRITLPTPPSFSRRRQSLSSSTSSPERQSSAASDSVSSDSPPEAEIQWVKSHGRSVSFHLPTTISPPLSPTDMSRNLDTHVPDDSLKSPGVYRIPQRSPDYVPMTHSPLAGPANIEPVTRRAPPRPLSLSPASQRFVGPGTGISPTTRLGPMTAPAAGTLASNRWSSTAAARGLTIAPALAKQRHSTSSASGAHSIWSASLVSLGAASGWISPALASARSVGSSARTRGLTAAVLGRGNEILMETLPTPGLGRSFPIDRPEIIREEKEEEMETLRDEIASPDPAVNAVSPSINSVTGDDKRSRESKSELQIQLITSHSLQILSYS